MPAFSVKQDLSWEEALMALKLDESCDVKTSVDLSSPSRLSFLLLWLQFLYESTFMKPSVHENGYKKHTWFSELGCFHAAFTKDASTTTREARI